MISRAAKTCTLFVHSDAGYDIDYVDAQGKERAKPESGASGRPGGRGSALRTFAGAMVSFLAIRDDGEGVPRDSEGGPDFRYVATHICDYPEDCYLLLPVVP